MMIYPHAESLKQNALAGTVCLGKSRAVCRMILIYTISPPPPAMSVTQTHNQAITNTEDAVGNVHCEVRSSESEADCLKCSLRLCVVPRLIKT